ncbi:hypothetical protein HUJ04_003894 [Dendroctonus ponderosae]|nr:hypothetical protein HUJ04_003894 [Dendroctonus ponderosae]
MKLQLVVVETGEKWRRALIRSYSEKNKINAVHYVPNWEKYQVEELKVSNCYHHQGCSLKLSTFN